MFVKFCRLKQGFGICAWFCSALCKPPQVSTILQGSVILCNGLQTFATIRRLGSALSISVGFSWLCRKSVQISKTMQNSEKFCNDVWRTVGLFGFVQAFVESRNLCKASYGFRKFCNVVSVCPFAWSSFFFFPFLCLVVPPCAFVFEIPYKIQFTHEFCKT